MKPRTLSKLTNLLRFIPGVTVTPAKTHRRSYQAARRDRLVADWTSYPTTSNWELRLSLRTLRARARQLARYGGADPAAPAGDEDGPARERAHRTPAPDWRRPLTPEEGASTGARSRSGRR